MSQSYSLYPVHGSQKTQKWIDKHSTNIRLIFLPAYSPDLNPDEMLNHDVKSNAVLPVRRTQKGRKKRPPTLQDIIDNVQSYLRRRRR